MKTAIIVTVGAIMIIAAFGYLIFTGIELVKAFEDSHKNVK